MDIDSTLRASCRLLLRPVASVLLKCGMTWREFSELSKSVFVAVASEEFGRRGRPTNVSRVSILTGISRKEVKRQRELLASAQPVPTAKTTDATRLLSGWHQDPEFVDQAGKPLALPIDGNGANFATLFARYGGDTPMQTLISELKSAGSVAADSAGRLTAERRYHMPVQMDPGSLRFFGTNLYDHAQTLNDNLAGAPEDRRLEGFAVDDRVHPDAVEAFKAFVEARGQQFLEEIDDWLSQNRVGDGDEDTDPVRLGIGIYCINGPLPEGKQS